MTDITVELAFDAIKIRFGGVLHAHIVRSKLLGLQSWHYGSKNYYIEYAMTDGFILCEYDDLEKFNFILSKLDGLL